MRPKITISAFDESIDAKEVIKWIDECCLSDRPKDKAFLNRIVALNMNSLGIKRSESPFNINKKVTEKYIKEVFDLSADRHNENLSAEGIKILGQKMVRVFIESAQSVDNRNGKQCNPYFRLYLNTYSKNNRLVFKSKPFVSNAIRNTANPKWETKLDIVIEDSATDDPIEKVFRHDLLIEVWSQKPSVSWYQTLSNRLFGYEFDDYLGSVCLTIGKRSSFDNFLVCYIPSTSTLHKLSFGDESNATVSVKTVWGRQTEHSEHRMFLKYHILLYMSSLKYQLKGLQRTADLDVEDLSWLTLLYMPAISLLNQHKIQSNLSTYEDSIIRRIVLTELLIRHKSDTTDSRNSSLILAKVLANEDITRKPFTAWLSKNYISTINDIERHFVLKLLKETKNEINILTTRPIRANSAEKTEPNVRRLLYTLKCLRKYHRKYRDLDIRSQISSLMGKQIITWIKNNIDFKVWSQIIAYLAVLAEHLRDYWYRLQVIVNYSEVNQILNKSKTRVKQMIDQWKKANQELKQFKESDQTSERLREYEEKEKANEQLSEDILSFFLFLTELNEFFTNPTEMATIESDSTEDPKTSTNEDNEASKERVVDANKPIEQYLKQINVKKLRKTLKTKIKLEELKFSQFLKTNRSENIEFWKDIDEEVFNHWIEKRKQSLETFVIQMGEQYGDLIENGSEEQIKEVIGGRIATKFFFNSVSQLLYFSLAVSAKHNWNYKKFCDILEQLCTICCQFSREMKDWICVESNDSQRNYLFLSVFCLNAIELMQKTHLRTDLLEVITDTKATHIRRILSQTKEVKQNSDTNDNLFEKWSEVFKCCKYIDSVAAEVQEFQYQITEELSDYIVRQMHKHLADIVTNYDNFTERDSKYQMIDKYFDKTFADIKANVIQKQLICDIILRVKLKTEKVFVSQLEHIFNVLERIDGIDRMAVDSKQRQIVELFKYLDKIYNNLAQKMSHLLSTDQKVTTTEEYCESESIEKMKESILKCISERLESKDRQTVIQ